METTKKGAPLTTRAVALALQGGARQSPRIWYVPPSLKVRSLLNRPAIMHLRRACLSDSLSLSLSLPCRLACLLSIFFLPLFISVCIHTYVQLCIFAYTYTYMYVHDFDKYTHRYIHTHHTQTYIRIDTCIHTYMHTCMHTCIHAHTHTHTHACMHAFVDNYIHTCVHANIRTCILHACMSRLLQCLSLTLQWETPGLSSRGSPPKRSGSGASLILKPATSVKLPVQLSSLCPGASLPPVPGLLFPSQPPPGSLQLCSLSRLCHLLLEP